MSPARTLLSAAAVLALAGSAMAQNPPPAGVNAGFTLQLQLVGRPGDDGAGNMIDQASPAFGSPFQTYRMEVLYRIGVGPNATGGATGGVFTTGGASYVSTGLTAAAFNVVSNVGPAYSGNVSPSALSEGEDDGSSNPASGRVNPDSSGWPASSGNVGLITPFRTGLGGGPQANGVPNVTSLGLTNVLPLNTSSPSELSTRAATIFWGVFAFDFTPGLAAPLGDVTFHIDVTQWTLWIRKTTGGIVNYDPADGVGTPSSNSFTVRFTPAPGALPLLGMGCFVAGRRRRA